MKISSLPGKAIEVEGELSEPRVKKIISTLFETFPEITKDRMHGKKLFTVVIELINNIYHHGLAKKGTLQIYREGDGFEVLSTNLLAKEKVPEILPLLQTLSRSSKMEILDLKNESLFQKSRKDENLGGIGLFEMALNAESFSFSLEDEPGRPQETKLTLKLTI